MTPDEMLARQVDMLQRLFNGDANAPDEIRAEIERMKQMRKEEDDAATEE